MFCSYIYVFDAHSRPKVVVAHGIGRIECSAPSRIFPRDVAYGYNVIEAQKKEYARLCGRLRKKLKILVDEAAMNQRSVYGQEHPWDTNEDGAE